MNIMKLTNITFVLAVTYACFQVQNLNRSRTAHCCSWTVAETDPINHIPGFLFLYGF